MCLLSLCMIVKNEEGCIKRCLESVKGVVDEIIIVDTGSEDRTKEYALEYTDKVFEFEWKEDFAQARNYGLEKATGKYCIVLDADEWLDSQSKMTLRQFVEKEENVVGRIRIRDKFISNGEEKIAYSWISRIFPRGIYYKGAIHEQIESNLQKKNINIIIHHDGYLKNNKVDRNLPILLKELAVTPTDCYLLYQVGKQYHLKNEYELAAEYYIQAYNVIQENLPLRKRLVVDLFYVLKELKAFDVVLELSELENEYFDDEADFYFVLGLIYMDICIEFPAQCENYIGYIEKSYLRCIEIGDVNTGEGTDGTGSYLAYYNLGVYYELFGQKEKAKENYEMSAKYGYEKAKIRLKEVNN